MGEGRSCAASVWRERPRAEGRWPGLLRWWACYCGFAWVYNKHPLPRWLFLFSLKLSFPNSKRINSQIFSWFYLLAVFLLFPDQFVNPLIPAPIYRYSFFVVLGFFEQSNPQYMWLPGSWPELLKAQFSLQDCIQLETAAPSVFSIFCFIVGKEHSFQVAIIENRIPCQKITETSALPPTLWYFVVTTWAN